MGEQSVWSAAWDEYKIKGRGDDTRVEKPADTSLDTEAVADRMIERINISRAALNDTMYSRYKKPSPSQKHARVVLMDEKKLFIPYNNNTTLTLSLITISEPTHQAKIS